jgi:hypothetical protein
MGLDDEEEMTSILQSRSVTGPLLRERPLPAAGRPASSASSAPPPASAAVSRRAPASNVRSSSRPPPSRAFSSSVSALGNDDDADDEDDGRTAVRGNPKKVVRRAPAGPSSISPAAVIKATVESARASQRREQLMPGPPSNLLEDDADLTENLSSPRSTSQRPPYSRSRSSHPPASFEGPPSRGVSSRSNSSAPSYVDRFANVPQQQHSQSFGPAPMPMTTRTPVTGPPAPFAGMQPGQIPTHAQYQQHQAQSHYSSAPPPQPTGSVPGVAASVPAHFMTPHAPPYGDPPGLAVTSGHRVAGRPALSWAAALLACGLFVGVAAVAVIQSSESVADTTASFVDPARAPVKNAAAQPPPAAAPLPPPVAAAMSAPAPNTPPGVIGASAEPPPPAPGVAFQPVAVTPAAAPAAPAAKPRASVAASRPAPAAAPIAKPAPQKPAPAAAATTDDDPPPKKTAKKGGKAEMDDETKKAIEALQKAQLESSSSFGKE